MCSKGYINKKNDENRKPTKYLIHIAGAGQMAGSLVKGWISKGVLAADKVLLILNMYIYI